MADWFGDMIQAVKAARDAGAAFDDEDKLEVYGTHPVVGLGELEIVIPETTLVKVDGKLVSWAELCRKNAEGGVMVRLL